MIKTNNLIFLLFFIVLLVLLIIFFTSYNKQTMLGRGEGWNVLLVTVDALRPDHLGCNKYLRDTSPTIDYLASQGIMFENAHSQSPHTHTSIASLMTSTYPIRHRSVVGSRPLSKDAITLAEILRDNHYRTGAFVQNYWLTEKLGFGQGFEEYNQLGPTELSNAVVEDSIITWLASNDDRPFFLWLHYLEPHATYLPRRKYLDEFIPEYEGKDWAFTNEMLTDIRRSHKTLKPQALTYIKACYDSEIRWCDTAINRILDSLSQSGLRSRTLIVFLSDHGEEFQDHGSLGHDHTLYEELLHVPLVFHAPSVLQKNIRLSETIETVDVLPTVLEFLGIEIPEEVQGESLLRLIAGEDSVEPDLAFAQRYFYRRESHLVSVLDYPWKMIVQVLDINRSDFHNWSLDPERCQVQLYNLENDPKEQRDISVQNESKVSNLFRKLQLWAEQSQNINIIKRFDEKPLEDENLKEKLKSMGYLQ